MAHFAKLDANNIVTFVTVGRQEDDGQEAALTARTGDVYKQTSYNSRGGVHYGRTANRPTNNPRRFARITRGSATATMRLAMPLYRRNLLIHGC